jgi:hypothetical protein
VSQTAAKPTVGFEPGVSPPQEQNDPIDIGDVPGGHWNRKVSTG